VSGGYYFILIGKHQKGGASTLTSVGLYTDSLKISESLKLKLQLRRQGYSSGDYFSTDPNTQNPTLFQTNSNYTVNLSSPS